MDPCEETNINPHRCSAIQLLLQFSEQFSVRNSQQPWRGKIGETWHRVGVESTSPRSQALSRAVQACSPSVPGHSDTLTSHPAGRGREPFSKDLGQAASQQVQFAISPALILYPLWGTYTQTKTQAMSLKFKCSALFKVFSINLCAAYNILDVQTSSAWKRNTCSMQEKYLQHARYLMYKNHLHGREIWFLWKACPTCSAHH